VSLLHKIENTKIMSCLVVKRRQILIICLFLCFSSIINSQPQPATAKEYQKVFTTYPYSDPNPIPVIPKPNFYNTFISIYPYFRYDGYTDKPVQKSWKVVELENEYIKVIILPEIGGKIWTAIEKSTNQPFIYYNHSVKFRDLGMRGPYTSGGLELNYGIIGHTPNCATPVDYIVQNNQDGSVSCIVGVLDLLTRSNWRLEIRLPKDKAYFTTRSFWYNSTPIEQPYYTWLNGGFKAAGNLEFIFPGTHYIGHGGESHEWPINKSNGANISFYDSNNFKGYKSYHVFGKYTHFSGGYWHDDDFGVVRYGTHDDKAGKKIWIWGLSGQGMIWEKILTDTDGQYVEMQSGRLFTQNEEAATYTPFKHLGFAPYATDTWTEYWYPVLKTKGFVEANEYGALNIKKEDGLLKIHFSPVQTIDDQLVITDGQNIIYSRRLQLAPLKTFADSIKFNGDIQHLKTILGENKLIYNSDPQANILNRPVAAPADFNWESAFGLYVLGKEAMDQKMYPLAEEKLEASLKKDQNYLPALLKLAELKYRNMLYSSSLEYARRALSIDTQDGGANYYYGLANAGLGNIIDAKDGFDLATLSIEYRSAAYTELSRLYLKEKSFEKAMANAERAVDYNRYNIEALQLQAVVARCQNDLSKEATILQTLQSYDPLNHFARFEEYLIKPSEESKMHFISLIRNELPQETYMELGVWYYNSGCPEEAAKVFSISPETAETIYWLSFLQNKKVNCAAINPAFVFPFRSETGFVLEQLLARQSDWLLKYHLALIYKDRNRVDECNKLLMSCADQPRFAAFYAYRAEILKGKNDPLCENDLKMAVSLDNQWRYQMLLADYYNDHLQYEKALTVTEAAYRSNPGNYMVGSLHAKTLLMNGKYKEADALLAKITIIPAEGNTTGHELYREAKMLQAAESMQKKNYTTALKIIDQAKLWPENLGEGKPYDEDIDMRLEDWMSYLCYMQLNKPAEAGDMLKRIIKFEPLIENTVKNFFPANALVTAWAFDKLNRRSEAIQWLNDQIRDFPNFNLLLWSKSVFEKEKIYILPEDEKDATVVILKKLTSAQM
jgi:tetratricopeptide (TPR) repeat protein